ncbi:flavin reductase family protein [Bacillus alveayuensis]|uniref:Flavin reductase (DIM6/NTAB) family NADH-FMN oxidoreductase RutF n=1 Tax=Aeribacillus alveayuensis TaxID=279215 RepID=A0ABT9VPH4_9BACI|nr:flavin reductase family protein [Bacillus alveayuensis]MDQ0162879.1 flavin reductase (DIM6/NTAB) family NADH-FMN oxidoreductase RutF [Bacillus alveayuensis]
MDDRTFRNAMGKFATGVTVITTSQNGEVRGMTANAFMSVSLDPKLVLISVGEKAKMNEMIKETGKFTVNILSEDQKEMSMLFAGQLKEDRKVDFDWIDGHPILPNSLASILCDVYDAHIAGDHTLYIGKVTNIHMNDGDPLLFFEGKYRNIANPSNVG